MFRVCETFVSIAGESAWQGFVATFIRFSGCDVECVWCDTEYAREEEGKEVSLEDLISICRANQTKRVVLTGGEPLIQEELPELCKKLLVENYAVQVETSGTRLADKLDAKVMKVIDIKPPGAKAKKGFHWGNLDLLSKKDEVKFVLAGKEDYQWALRIIEKCRLEERCNVILSAATGKVEPKQIAEWMVEDRIGARLQLQLHKILWPGEKRGK